MLLALVVASALSGQVAQSMAPTGRFIDFHEDLKRHDVAVVFGTLGSLKEGKKERLKPEEAGGLGEGGAQVVVSGAVFYRVKATGKLEAAEVHCGLGSAGEKIPIAFEMNTATLPSGDKKRHLIGPEDRAELFEETVALFVLEKPPGKAATIRRVTRFEAKSPEDLAKAKDVAADWYAINRAKLDLLVATEEATTLRDRGDKSGAIEKLRAVLDAKRTWRRLESDGVASQALSAARSRAIELRKDLEREK